MTQSTLSQTTTSDSSKLKEFPGDNFKFDENGCKFSKRVENSVEKRRNCLLRAIFFSSQCFQNTYTEDM